MIEQTLQWIALYARRRYRRIFVVTGILVALSALACLRLRFDTEVLNLLPQDDPVVRTFRQTLADFGSLDFLLIVVRIPEGAAPDPYFGFVEELAGSLEALPEIQYVDYRIGELERLVEEFLPRAFLFLDEGARDEVEAMVSEEGIRARVQNLRRQLQTPQSLALRELVLLDPLGLSQVFFDRLVGGRGGLKVDWTSGYFLSLDRSLLLLVAKPAVPAQEIDFARRLLDKVNEQVAGTSSRWPEIAGAEPPPPPIVDLGGTYATAVADAGYLRRDVTTNGLASMIGVLVLFLLAFRRLGTLGYAFVPLNCGLILALGFAAITVGSLNAVTSGFAALLGGLGIDFVIVSYGRYVEERRKGQRLAGALRAMNGSSGRAVVTGGITTSATFYAFFVTEFSGLRQMGALIGTGVLFCMASILVLLPALLAWSEDRHSRRRREVVRRVHGLGAAHLVRWCWRRPRLTIAVSLVVTALSAWGARDIEFVDSIRQMRPASNRGVLVETEIGQKFGSGFDYMMLVLEEPDEAGALSRTAEVADRARRLVGTELLSVDSITNVVPPPARQQAVIDWLGERAEAFDAQRVRRIFAQAAVEQGLRPQAFERGFELFQAAVTPKEPVTVGDLLRHDDTRRLVERFLKRVEGGYRSVVYLYPPPRTWKREAPPGVVALARDLEGEAVLTGVNLVSESLRKQVKEDAIHAALLGFVLVVILLWIDFRRRVFETLLSLGPLLVGLVWMLGGMALLHEHMNFFNVFVTAMIIGIGVDYGVHMIHRYMETWSQGEEQLEAGLEETAKVVALAAVATSFGFGSLTMSSYPGLRSMGLVAIMGALACCLVAITLLPAFFKLRLERRGRKTKGGKVF